MRKGGGGERKKRSQNVQSSEGKISYWHTLDKRGH